MKASKSEKKIKLAVAQATENIRNKFKQIHDNRAETYRQLEEAYQPITRKLHALINVNEAATRHSQSLQKHNHEKEEEGEDDTSEDLRARKKLQRNRVQSRIKKIQRNKVQKRNIKPSLRKTMDFTRRLALPHQREQIQLHHTINDVDESMNIQDLENDFDLAEPLGLPIDKRSLEHSEIDSDLQRENVKKKKKEAIDKKKLQEKKMELKNLQTLRRQQSAAKKKRLETNNESIDHPPTLPPSSLVVQNKNKAHARRNVLRTSENTRFEG